MVLAVLYSFWRTSLVVSCLSLLHLFDSLCYGHLFISDTVLVPKYIRFTAKVFFRKVTPVLTFLSRLLVSESLLV